MTDGKNKNLVYYVSLVVIGGLVAWGLAGPSSFAAATQATLAFCFKYMTWWFLLGMNLFVIFPLYMAFGRYANLKLGEADEVPEFTSSTWIAMLFGGGMGVGLVFYGVGAPILTLMDSPYGSEPGSVEAAVDGMRVAFYHWGFHPWACFALIGLCLAYFQYRKKKPGLMSSLLLPLLGPKGNDSFVGRVVDILAIFAIVAGVATSIGMTGMQVNSGLFYVFGIPINIGTQVIILVIIGVIYTWATVSGIHRGIKILGNINMYLTLLLCGALLLIGPTITILESFVTGVGSYMSTIVWSSLNVAPYGGDYKSWLGNWTVFYWAWWISWAPFVGAFVARISRGRTVREFVIGVYVVPVLGCWSWFAIFGATALNMQLTGVADIAAAIDADVPSGVFAMYDALPIGSIMSALMIILIATYLITSANASTFAIAMYTSQGDMNPPKTRTAIWGVLQSALAIVLLLTGGLASLQTASVASAGPFSIVMVLAAYCLLKTLRQDFPEGTEIR